MTPIAAFLSSKALVADFVCGLALGAPGSP
jgi:hypothetical protein